MATTTSPARWRWRDNTLVTGAGALAQLARPRCAATSIELPEALVLDGPLGNVTTPRGELGSVVAQSRAAMIVARALDPCPAERVASTVCGTGGKATNLAARIAGVAVRC